ncbi:hypothetical protein L2X99_00050 [Microbacterium sp. KUDC0406]|uniref:DUF6264 family protein n=1 Tax=Microbacterium sp. KUDC0406 TaxID=2909588 RepID=UPI001F258CFE|nr:DUF6264 family protein [Microbacterium sp. KUDC0406]UJP10161.1 hypothetical protein L2X99_00050 [Microbacterium sp. KUDC0406]
MSDEAHTQERAPSRAVSRIGAGLGYLLVQVVASYAAYMILVMQALSIAGCSDQCDYDLVAASMQVQIWASALLWILAVIGVTWRSLLGRSSWWVPVVGIGAVALLTIVTCIAVDIATPMLDR